MLPNDMIYQRKVERMSSTVLPTFLKQREILRQQYTHEESERQRERKISSHCLLFRIYTVIDISMRDMWKAQEHLRQAFVTCKTEEEHISLLKYFHGIIVQLSVIIFLLYSTFISIIIFIT
jgi:hypothetical protein